MELVVMITLASLVGGAFSLVGGIVLLYREELARRISIYLVSFAAGTLLSVAFLDLMPEALEAVEEAGGPVEWIFSAAIIGFLFFFLIEGLLFRIHHHHNSEEGEFCKDEHVTRAPTLLIIGDTLHNFLDGVAITTAFLIDPSVGIVTSLAVAAHEIPQEIGDFSVMIHAGWDKRSVFLWNLFPALATTVGALLTLALRNSLEPILGYLLAGTAGVFIYIAASDLVPELYHVTRRDKIAKTVPLFFLGILIMSFVTRLVE